MTGVRPLDILLVEDDEVDAMSVRRACRNSSAVRSLRVVNNGEDALRLLRQPDEPSRRQLILLDLNTPRMGGMEMLKSLRADPGLRRMVVVVMTTSNDPLEMRSAYELNVAGYLIKPSEPAQLKEMLDALVQYWEINQLP